MAQRDQTTDNKFDAVVSEIILKGVEFENWLPLGESLSSLTGWTGDASVTVNTSGKSGSRVWGLFTPTAAGEYEMTATVVLSTGETRKGRIVLRVKA